jgi:hypothetical protein
LGLYIRLMIFPVGLRELIRRAVPEYEWVGALLVPPAMDRLGRLRRRGGEALIIPLALPALIVASVLSRWVLCDPQELALPGFSAATQSVNWALSGFHSPAVTAPRRFRRRFDGIAGLPHSPAKPSPDRGRFLQAI